MLSGSEIPLERLAQVLRHALPVLMEGGQVVFGSRVPLEGSGTVVLYGFGIIPGNALAMFVQIAEKEFRVGIILGGGSTEPLEGRLIVLIGGIMPEIRLRESILGDGIAVLRLRLQGGKGSAGILLRFWRGVTGLNHCKYNGDKHQPCKKLILPA